MDSIKELALPKSSIAVERLEQVLKLLEVSGFGDKINVDFSVISDTHYYNGFVFKGFIEGISSRILSGGQYDNLMKRMKLDSGAIGFAVYLDMLERFEYSEKDYDVDCVLLYDDTCDIFKINETVSKMTTDGVNVIASKTVPANIKYKELYKLNECGVEKIEKNA
jgi:ATP phosphoribosyltransferase regulatory subunit